MKYSKHILMVVILLAFSIYGSTNPEAFTIIAETGGVPDGEKGGLKKIGSADNAKMCQDKCIAMKNCKYVNRPAHLKVGDRGDCYMSADFDQELAGSLNDGNSGKKMTTWENKLYVKPKRPEHVHSGGGYNFSNRNQAKAYCKKKGYKLCHSKDLIKKRNGAENVCYSGWTTDKRGWWVGRWRGWGCGGHWRRYWNGWSRYGRSGAHCCTT
jgi:hypothetical protein